MIRPLTEELAPTVIAAELRKLPTRLLLAAIVIAPPATQYTLLALAPFINVMEIPAVVFIAAGVMKINFESQLFLPSRMTFAVIATAAVEIYAPGVKVLPPKSAGTAVALNDEIVAIAPRKSVTTVEEEVMLLASGPLRDAPRVVAAPETI
jgi:hypothetical protein